MSSYQYLVKAAIGSFGHLGHRKQIVHNIDILANWLALAAGDIASASLAFIWSQSSVCFSLYRYLREMPACVSVLGKDSFCLYTILFETPFVKLKLSQKLCDAARQWP